jgi:hypothetical protein
MTSRSSFSLMRAHSLALDDVVVDDLDRTDAPRSSRCNDYRLATMTRLPSFLVFTSSPPRRPALFSRSISEMVLSNSSQPLALQAIRTILLRHGFSTSRSIYITDGVMRKIQEDSGDKTPGDEHGRDAADQTDETAPDGVRDLGTGVVAGD